MRRDPVVCEGNEGIRCLAVITASFALLVLSPLARAHTPGAPEPARIARISRQVFGARWRVAACIAHYESTDGAWLYNGVNLGPWQVSVQAHPWVNARWVVLDWRYAARVAFRLSAGGRDWSSWTTRGDCGV